MTKKNKSILLIDDSRADVFLHERAIQKAGVGAKVVTCSGAKEALQMIEGKDGNKITPDLILLDINMPDMDGWDFLDEFKQLSNDVRGGAVVCMLTTSNSPTDKEKASEYKEVKGYYNKPLVKSDLDKMLEEV